MAAAEAIARRAFADGRIRTFSFAYLFAFAAYANVVGYRSAYPAISDRLALAHSLGNNDAVRLFYGKPYDLLSVGGYVAWRVGGVMTIFAAVWGLLAAVRALRAEEDAGRAELVLAGILARRGIYLAALAAIAAGALFLWLATFLGLAVAGLALGGSAYLALAILTMAPVFAGIGALASQLAPTRRIAIELSSGALLLFFLARVVADTSTQLGWLRWATPLGWAEELRPFTGARPAVLLLPLAASALLLIAAGAISLRRDVGTGLLPAHDSAPLNPRLLSSPTAQTLRGERGSLVAWLAGSGFFAFIIGVISTSISSAGLSGAVQRQLRQVTGVSIITPAGYIGFTFVFFVLVLSLFACAQLAAARNAELDQQLETLFALPVSRIRWLMGRLVLAIAGMAALGLCAGVLAWAGAATQNAGVSFVQMLEAGANCLPVALLFLGLGALAYAMLPRASSGIAYGLVIVAFVWQLFGSVLSVPKWALELTPFAHVGLIPAQAFRAGDAAVMLAIGFASMLAAVWLFARRDLSGP
jgi:polyether ionophore transport system permease protein